MKKLIAAVNEALDTLEARIFFALLKLVTTDVETTKQ